MEVNIQHRSDLGDAHPQSVVKPGGEDDQAVSESGTGEGIGNRRFHQFPARGAPLPGDAVSCDFRPNLRDVFDQAETPLGRLSQRGAAFRTVLHGRVLHLMGDLRRVFSSFAGMPFLRSRPFASFSQGRFLVGRNHARGSGCRLALQACHSCGKRNEHENDRLPPQIEDPLVLLVGQGTGEVNEDCGKAFFMT